MGGGLVFGKIAEEARRDRQLGQGQAGRDDAVDGGADAADLDAARLAPGRDRSKAGLPLRGVEIGRISAAVDSIVASGLTLSKLTVAASLLGDLAKE